MATTTKTRPKADAPTKLADTRALLVSAYRDAVANVATGRHQAHLAVWEYFSTLPDSERKTVKGKAKTVPVSERQRAADALEALAVKVDEKGKALDALELSPVRVVQIVKAFRRAKTALGTTSGDVKGVLASETGEALVQALDQFRKTSAGEKGADALAKTIHADDAVSDPSGVSAEAAKALEKARTADKAKEDKPEPPKPPKDSRPIERVSNALDSLEDVLKGDAAELDPQQKKMLAARFAELAKHLS